MDATFQTSHLGGDKNFLIGVYGMMTGREGLGGDRSAVGGKFDYPNDRWDFALSWKRIGDGFDTLGRGIVSQVNKAAADTKRIMAETEKK
mgnify:CR=1 FL=1